MTTLCGYTYADIRRLEAENRRLRFCLQTIVFGKAFGQERVRGIREARRLALRALTK